MSKEKFIFPGHGTVFNTSASKAERQRKSLEKNKIRISRSKNKKSNNHQDTWTLAKPEDKFIIYHFYKNGTELNLTGNQLPEMVIPINASVRSKGGENEDR